MKKHTLNEKIFQLFLSLLMIGVAIAMLYPMWYVIVGSFSDSNEVIRSGGKLLWIKKFTLGAYEVVLNNKSIWSGYANTLFILFVGTALSIFFTILGGYFLSKKNVLFKNVIAFLVVLTMYFSGGMIPHYFNIRQLGLYDTLWSQIFPVLVNTFNMIIMRTAFESIPQSLPEAAGIDGSGELRTLFKILLPCCKSTIAVLVLYYGVSYWNSWFNAMLYMESREKFPLQLILREIVMYNQMKDDVTAAMDRADLSETISYATIVVATVPILVIYPFMQRYFEKGAMVGSVKG